MAGRPIDEKIVAMKMDNSDFKQKAMETTSLFGRLKQTLANVPGVSNGLSRVTESLGNISSAAQKVDLSSIGSNVDTVANRFSSLSVIATTALATITAKATMAGAAMLKSVTVQPLADGFREYENKMSSIGTMLSNTEWNGSTLSDVKKTLGELNDYADNTIYSFEQMTANVGRFTAAGVTLEDSATAIKGLGNLAASSGSNVDQLNTVMYQMSQALSAGKLNLMDWNSLVNGGMAGKKTQDALVATAKAMGKNVDLSDGFRNSIEQGWLTSEVFLETLKKFGKDKSMTEAATSVRTFTGMMGALKESIGSGWAETWELIFGDFEVATRRWTALSEVIGGFFQKGTDARNKFVKSLADAGIFEGFFKLIVNTGKAILDIFGAVGKGISKAFSGPKLGILSAFGKGLNAFADSIKVSDGVLNAITIVFQALFSIVSVLMHLLVGLGKVVLAVVAVPFKILIFLIDGLISGVVAVAGFIGNLVMAFTDAVVSGEALTGSVGFLKKAFSTVGSWIGKAIQHISTWGSAMQEVWGILSKGDFTGVGPWAEDSKIVDKLFDIREGVLKFAEFVSDAWEIIAKNDFSDIGPWANNPKIFGKLIAIREAVVNFVGAVKEAWGILAHGDFTGVGPWEEDSKIVDKLFDIRESVIKFVEFVGDAWEIIAKNDFSDIGPWANKPEVFERLIAIREGVTDFANGVVEAWNILAKGKFTGVGPWEKSDAIVDGLFRIRDAVIDFGNAVAEVYSVLIKGDYINVGPWSEDSPIIRGLLKIREGFQSLGKFASTLNFSALLVPIMGAFSILGDFLSSLDFGVVLLPIATGFAYIADKVSGMSVSLTPVANAFSAFFDMLKGGFDWIVDKLSGVGEAIKNAMPSGQKLFAGGFIAGMVGIVGMALKMAWDLMEMFKGWGNIGKGISDTLEGVSDSLNAFSWQVRAQALMVIAIAVGILTAALWTLTKLKPAQVATALGAMTGSLAALIGAMWLMQKYDIAGTGMKSAIQIVALSVAFLILSSALRKISDLGWEEITKGIVGLAGTMGIFAGAVAIMGKFGGPKLGASALQMLALAGTVWLLVIVLKQIAATDTGVLAKGMTGLAIALGIFAGAVMIMSRTGGKVAASALQFVAIAGSVLMLVGAIKLIAGIDVGSLAKGLITITLILAVIAGFTQLSKGMLTSGAGIMLLAVALNMMIIPLAILGNMSLETLAKGLGAMAVALLTIGLASKLMTGMMAMGAGLLLVAIALNAFIVPIVTLGNLPLAVLATGIIAIAGAILLIGGAAALLGLAGPALLIGAAGIAALGIAMLAAGAGLALFSTALVTLATMTGAAVTTIVAFLGTLIVGLASLIPTAVAFVWKLIQGMAIALRDNAPQLATTLLEAVLRMLDVIAVHIPKFIDAGTKIITNFLDGIAKNLPQIVESATNLMVTFVEALAAAVQTNGPRFVEAITTLMAEVMIIFVQTGAAVVEALFGWIPGVTAATQEISNSAEQTIRDVFDAQGVGEEKGGQFASGLGGKSGDAKSAGAKVGESGKAGADSTTLTGVGQEKGTQFANALGAKAGAAKSAGANVGNSGKAGADGVSLTGAGSGAGSEFASALSGKSGAARTAGLNVGNSGKAGADGISLTGAGSGAGSEFASALSGKSGAANTAGVNLANGGKSGAGSVSMNTVGLNFGQGFANGISGAYDSVYSKAKSLAVSAKNAVMEWIDAHSPSRDTHKIGGYFGQGFANGIAETASNVVSSSKKIALTAKESLNNFMDGFELPEEDNELHFKAVIDYDTIDPSSFGKIAPLGVSTATSTTARIASSIPTKANIDTGRSSQNVNTSTMLRQQEEQIALLKQQNGLLSNISEKDYSTYLDGKEIYNSNKTFQNNQATVRNIFKGVSPA